MRANLFFLTLTASATLLLSSCDNKAAQTETATTTTAPADSSATATTGTAATYYTCEMHPEVHSDQPGKCPKCGMTLVKK
ncbi:heavy metal-binding domain-containing protein [Hymenobacter terricola]|uniref:heavy metal-binding domain-containing protein n=1 Tax=Hymenobacter terricola TaxID=2819236 RepID=UPI001B31742D|nr:heavy metal-binding domain-containing protein [Hymenobacter terricola]